MDRRQKKTREAIFQAFSKLLGKKRYEHITVQDIIDEANIGRSTFYAHFETRDDLLRSLCMDIFQHVFTAILPGEPDFPEENGRKSLELKLGHILFHLRENVQNMKGILRGESGTLFLSFFQEYLNELFTQYLQDFPYPVPEAYLLHHLAGSFTEAVKWWIAEDMTHAPEDVAKFFMALLDGAPGQPQSSFPA